VVWAVAKGSAINKAVLVPAALAISALAPWAIIPLLMVGGAFLCFEGFEKLAHKFLHSKAEDAAHHADIVAAVSNPAVDMLAYEKEKVKGAIRTDFILSAEIIVISLGTVATATFTQQVVVLVGIAIIMTIGVYGLVAGIVKLDDLGLYLTRRPGAGLGNTIGRGILAAAPHLMRTLTVVGTAAMFLVGGGILAHGVPGLEAYVNGLVANTGVVIKVLAPLLLDALIGILAGALILAAVTAFQKITGKGKDRAAA